MQIFEKAVGKEIAQKSLKKIKAHFRVIIRQERRVIGIIHLIFDTKEGMLNFLVSFHENCIFTKLPESAFPSFCWNVYDVLKGSAKSCTNFQSCSITPLQKRRDLAKDGLDRSFGGLSLKQQVFVGIERATFFCKQSCTGMRTLFLIQKAATLTSTQSSVNTSISLNTFTPSLSREESRTY